MRLRELYIESASSGSTSASGIASLSNGKQSKRKYKKRHNPDGTIKNAVDSNENVFSGQPLKRN